MGYFDGVQQQKEFEQASQMRMLDITMKKNSLAMAQNEANQKRLIAASMLLEPKSPTNPLGTTAGETPLNEAATRLITGAQTSLRLGNLDEATKLLADAAAIGDKGAIIDERATKTRVAQLEEVGAAATAVTDKPAADNFFKQYEQLYPHIKNNPAWIDLKDKNKDTFSPETFQRFEQATVTLQDQAIIARDKANANRAKAAAGLDSTREDLLRAQVKNYDSLRENRNKAGVVKAASKPEMEQATALIRTEWAPGPQDKDALAANAATLVDEAKRLSTSSNLTFDQALHKAYDQLNSAHTFEGFRRKAPTPGLTPETPIDAPSIKEHMWSDPEPDPSAMIVNRWYKFPGGLVGKWDGKRVDPSGAR